MTDNPEAALQAFPTMNARKLVAITFVSASALGAQKAPDITPYLIPNRAAEVALARTAAPPAVSEKATLLRPLSHGEHVRRGRVYCADHRCVGRRSEQPDTGDLHSNTHLVRREARRAPRPLATPCEPDITASVARVDFDWSRSSR